MPYKHITQEEARDYRKRAENAEQKLGNWCSYVQPGISIGAETITEANLIRSRTARKLGFGVLMVPRQDTNVFDIYAVKP